MLQVSYSVKDYPKAEYPCSIVYEDHVMHDGVGVSHKQVCVVYWDNGSHTKEQARGEANRIAYLLNQEVNKGL